MSGDGSADAPDIVAVTRGGNHLLGMDGEAGLATASLDEAHFWQTIYGEILAMEESVLERIYELMVQQTPEGRREVELTNLPMVVAQADRFRTRLAFWTARVQIHEEGLLSASRPGAAPELGV